MASPNSSSGATVDPDKLPIPLLDCKAEINISMNGADVAISAVRSDGKLGYLYNLVLKECGYAFTEEWAELAIKKGFHWLEDTKLRPILFIKIDREDTMSRLSDNLGKSIETFGSRLIGKKIWLPTLATAEGWVSHKQSYFVNVTVFNAHARALDGATILMALPESKEGQLIVDTIREAKKRAPVTPTPDANGNPKRAAEAANGDGNSTQTADKPSFTIGEVKGKCWWLQADPDIWKVDALKVGAKDEYSTHNQKGNKRQVFDAFFEAKKGEWIIIYETSPSMRIKALAKVIKEAKKRNGDDIGFEIVYFFQQQTTWSKLKEQKRFASTTLAQQNQGSFFELDVNTFIEVLNTTELKGSVPQSSDQEEADKIPFHLDQVESTDWLNREPIASSLADILNTQVFTKTRPDHSFMIHLQGAWGDGKSTFMGLLKRHLKRERKWIVIDFNAWQHQHISPPWFAFLMKIYRQANNELDWWGRLKLWTQENVRRVILRRVITLVLTIVFAGLVTYLSARIFNRPELFGFKINDDGSLWGTLLEVIGGVGSAAGLVFSLAKFFVSPFGVTTPDEAKSFVEEATDPMDRIKRHFESLVGDLNKQGFEVAVFIDDLDRCNENFTVELLEGIQTLFQKKAVLYVVAGDRRWISNCFEHHYKEVQDVKDSGQRLGYLFLEKAFQLSIRLPNVSGEAKKIYWAHILNPRKHRDELQSTEGQTEQPQNKEDKEKLETTVKDLLKQESQTGAVNPDKIKEIREQHQVSMAVATQVLLKVMDGTKEDVRHLLENHYDLIDTNPRAIKRLANQYTVLRNILTAEQKAFNRDKLFRWLIMENKYPVFTDWLESRPRDFTAHEKEDLDESLHHLLDDVNWKKLMFSDGMPYGGPLLAKDIQTFIGGDLPKDKAKSNGAKPAAKRKADVSKA